MRTDIHTHAFHPKIAAKAVARLNAHYGITCTGLGTMDDLLAQEKAAGIERCVILCAATAAAQVIPVNNYAIAMQKEHENVRAFGSIHPDYAEWQKELARLKAHGIQGLKLHPEFQSFWLDDVRLVSIIEEAHKDFIFQIHIGDVLPPEKNPSCPYKMAQLLDAFPNMRLIATHLGGFRQWEAASTALVGRDIWLETSSSTPYIEGGLLRQIIQKHDQERILFGSDYPLYTPAQELQRLQCKAQLSDVQLETYLHNADKILPLSLN